MKTKTKNISPSLLYTNHLNIQWWWKLYVYVHQWANPPLHFFVLNYFCRELLLCCRKKQCWKSVYSKAIQKSTLLLNHFYWAAHPPVEPQSQLDTDQKHENGTLCSFTTKFSYPCRSPAFFGFRREKQPPFLYSLYSSKGRQKGESLLLPQNLYCLCEPCQPLNFPSGLLYWNVLGLCNQLLNCW